MNARTDKKGFTIIEVVLVLAIAALIFLMVFVALPALQRGQRDTARKNEAGTIASSISTYRGNNRGNLPQQDGDLDSYLEDLNQIINVTMQNAPDPEPNVPEDEAYVYIEAKCSNGGGTVSGTPRQAAVVVFVENGERYCQDA